MTETGAILISPTPLTPLKPGSCTRPLPGIEADVVTLEGKPVDADHGGFLVIRKPWPSMMRTIYKDPDATRPTGRPSPDVYFAGDAAHKDADGYFWVQGRVDDVIKVSGHRLGTHGDRVEPGQPPGRGRGGRHRPARRVDRRAHQGLRDHPQAASSRATR